MSLEKTSANIFIQIESEMVIQMLYPSLIVRCFSWIINRASIKISKPLQRVLIHRINQSQINNWEEQGLGSESNWSEYFTLNIDILFFFCWLFHPDVDIIRYNFGFSQNIDYLIIL